MEQPFITALSTSQSVVPSYVQAVNAIQAYCDWIITQSLPNQSLNNTLQQLRVHAGAWYNTIYPQYLNMPATIVSNGTTINGDLSILMTLAQQEEQQGSSPALQQQITQYANALIGTLQGLLTQVTGLASALAVFQQDLTGDSGTINNTLNSIQTTIYSLQQQLASAYGQLHSLQSATCPDKGKISACQNLINQLQQQLQQETQAYQVFSQAAHLIQGAIVGAQYLAGYWTGVANNIQACISGLQNISDVSGAILIVDLQVAQSQWNAIQSNFEQINNQIAE
jgi:hypothetical protein